MADQKISVLTELAETPASADEFVVVDKSDTTMGATGTNKRVQAQYLTIADASTTVKGKVELATDAETITGTDTVRAITPSNLTAALSPSQSLALSIMSSLNPVGTIREFTVSTNPGTLLGFGTWGAFGTGRVTVAIDAGQTEFDTNGETGGAKTHTLTGAESGTSVHSHGISDPGHFHTIGTTAGDQDGSGSNGSINGSSNTDTKTTGITVSNSSAANASSAHNNLQPYIVVYRWVRTA